MVVAEFFFPSVLLLPLELTIDLPSVSCAASLSFPSCSITVGAVPLSPSSMAATAMAGGRFPARSRTFYTHTHPIMHVSAPHLGLQDAQEKQPHRCL